MRQIVKAIALTTSVVVTALLSTTLVAQGKSPVIGTVTLNGQAVQERTIRFWHPATRTEAATVTDIGGRYSIDLPSTGDWILSSRGWYQSGRLMALDGGTQFDWAVIGEALEITLVGAREPTLSPYHAHLPSF